MDPFPTLNGFGPTRMTLQRYARAISAIARAHVPPQPHWWHVSLRVRPEGLACDNIPLPRGGILSVRLDPGADAVVVTTSDGIREEADLRAGLTGAEMGDWLIAITRTLGLEADYRREPFESDEPTPYDPDAARRFFTALVSAYRVFGQHRAAIEGETGPVQFWPHGFDLSTEWFGSRRVAYEENGKTTQLPAQLNLGFYPGNDDADSYFYSNPWPFEAGQLTHKPLPIGASWHTEGWQGTILPYGEIRRDPHPERRLLAYAAAVYNLASPTLRA